MKTSAFEKPSVKPSIVPKVKKTPNPTVAHSQQQPSSSAKAASHRAQAELSIAVVGHIDSGKSTLIGQLLVQTGCVPLHNVEKLGKEAKAIGKASFEYAWLLDESASERQRGITQDICTVQLKLKDLQINIIDCPGHADFVPNAIHGIIQADAGVLVVDLSPGEAECGLAHQTREHLLVLKAARLTRSLVILLNKADKISWSASRVQEVKEKMEPILEHLGFENVHYVVASGLKGENLLVKHAEANTETLVEALHKISPVENAHFDDKDLRIVVNDIVKSSLIQGTVCSGRIHKRDKLVLLPGNEQIAVKALFLASNEGKSLEECVSGQNILISLAGKEQEILSTLQRGYILTAAKTANPAVMTALFEAEIETFELPQAITLGWQATIHMHGMQETVMISKLFSCKSLWNASSEPSAQKSHPRLIHSECLAVVECKLMNAPIPMDLFHTHPQTGTFLLRSNGKTLASGKVTRIK